MFEITIKHKGKIITINLEKHFNSYAAAEAEIYNRYWYKETKILSIKKINNGNCNTTR